MTITFYNNKSENNCVNKDLVQTVSYSDAKATTDLPVQNPVILLKVSSFVNSNYCYIPELHRYYYVVSTNWLRNGLLEVTLKVDPLMSFKEDILSLTAIVERSNGAYDAYLPDPKQKLKSYTRISAIPFRFSTVPVVMGYDTEYAILVAAG